MRLRSGLKIIPNVWESWDETQSCCLCWDTCLDAWQCTVVVDTLRVFEVATHCAVYSPDGPMCVSWCTLRHLLYNNHWCCALYMCGYTFCQLSSDAHIAQMWMTISSDLDITMPTMMKVPTEFYSRLLLCWPFDNFRYLQFFSFPHTWLCPDSTSTLTDLTDPAEVTRGQVEAMEARAEAREEVLVTSLMGCSSICWTPSWLGWAMWGRTWSSSCVTQPPSSSLGRELTGEMTLLGMRQGELEGGRNRFWH